MEGKVTLTPYGQYFFAQFFRDAIVVPPKEHELTPEQIAFFNNELSYYEKERNKNKMRVTQVNIPSYAVEGMVHEFTARVAELEPTVRDNVWKAISNRGLYERVTIPMPDKATADSVLQAFTTPTLIKVDRTVPVRSKTDPFLTYQVGIRGTKPVNCTCPDYVNRSAMNPNHICKHMNDVAIYPSKFGLTY